MRLVINFTWFQVVGSNQRSSPRNTWAEHEKSLGPTRPTIEKQTRKYGFFVLPVKGLISVFFMLCPWIYLKMWVLVHPQFGLLWPASLPGTFFLFVNVTFAKTHDSY